MHDNICEDQCLHSYLITQLSTYISLEDVKIFRKASNRRLGKSSASSSAI